MIPPEVLTAIDTPSGTVAIDPNVLSTSLHCLSAKEVTAASSRTETEYLQYCRGLLVGTFSILIGAGWTIDKAIALMKRYCPKDYDQRAIPPVWLEAWEKCQEEPGS